jgi:hypothetical protein
VFCVRRARGRDSKGLWRADGREAATARASALRAGPLGPSWWANRQVICIAVSLGRSVKAKVEVIVSYRSSADSVAKQCIE